MKPYRADLHIHTVLSPCGALEMSPAQIVKEASGKKLDIIGITDHNSTRHCKLVSELAAREGIFVLMGAEVTTREEVHCLTFFENDDQVADFQHYLEEHLPAVPNDTRQFGYQVVVDENETIVDEIEWLLISALDQSIGQVEQKVHSLGGLFIPAHIDRPSMSLVSQLGFLPPTLNIDAVELANPANLEKLKPMLGKGFCKPVLTSSDAHCLSQIGMKSTFFEMEHRSFGEIRMALQQAEGRKTTLQ